MPWVRIDENALEHPKIVSLPDGVFRLWVQGLAYCQKYLTDGYISSQGLRSLRAYSPKRKGVLVTAGLWHDSETGVTVHDFLEWNDSRAHVLSARSMARKRLEKHKEKRVSSSVSNAVANAHLPVGYVCTVDSSGERGLGKTPSRPVHPPSDALAARAGHFVEEVYPSLYAKHRKGARYISKPALDFQEALELCRVWDDERLVKIATVFLTTNHEFAEKGSRTIAQFRSMASWCDDRLIQKGL